jgi:SAM-dependent MidA family methyltransferase
MGSSPESPTASPPDFIAVFRAHADTHGRMSFARFMELALYHPQVGYYRKSRARVGYGGGTDFYTATSTGPLFGELICAASVTLLQAAGRDVERHTFVEIGAEPGTGGIMRDVAHPFTSTRILNLGDPLTLASDCVVFSNELFDAQPCVRTVYRNGSWRERGVQLLEDASLAEVELEQPFAHPLLPATAPEGYCFDLPLAATALAHRIAEEPWQGLFIAFDYGKTEQQLRENTPAGTARAYYQHKQSNDLLAQPGEQDLTCHVCWDWMTDALRRHGFAEPRLEFQEAFLIHHAGDFIARVSAAEAMRMSRRKLALMQLLHPAHMGQKFQVLHSIR